jgi:UDP-N-acetylmuramyl pentapeptide phosphotransferase/UDP-N-acetylglucosamine-1-phosphate transferase
MPSFVLSDALKHLDIMPVLLGFGVTVIATGLLCRLSKVLLIGHDSAQGVQKFHVNPTSRLGGVAIFLGLAVSGLAVSGVAEFIIILFGFCWPPYPFGWLA